MTSNKGYNFKSAAIYKIVVNGLIDDSWADNFRGMQITIEREEGKAIFSTLVGEIRDQAALSGILTSLYHMQMTVISVNMLSIINNE